MNRLYSLEDVREARQWHIEFRDNLLRDSHFQEAIIESLTIAMLADLISSMESPVRDSQQ